MKRLPSGAPHRRVTAAAVEIRHVQVGDHKIQRLGSERFSFIHQLVAGIFHHRNIRPRKLASNELQVVFPVHGGVLGSLDHFEGTMGGFGLADLAIPSPVRGDPAHRHGPGLQRILLMELKELGIGGVSPKLTGNGVNKRTAHPETETGGGPGRRAHEGSQKDDALHGKGRINQKAIQDSRASHTVGRQVMRPRQVATAEAGKGLERGRVLCETPDAGGFAGGKAMPRLVKGGHDGAGDAGFLGGRIQACHGVASFAGAALIANIKNRPLYDSIVVHIMPRANFSPQLRRVIAKVFEGLNAHLARWFLSVPLSP